MRSMAALGGEWRRAWVSDALGRPVEARWLRLPDGRAVVESAEAIGLWRLAPGERDPLNATSQGLGELLLEAAGSGAREIVVTLGGSATVDGGAGLRRALAGRQLGSVRLRAAVDVTSPLLGPRGAARVFGPQKGATPAQVEELEERLASMPELRPYAELPGAGAAGGLGAALAALGATLEPGSALVADAVGLRPRLAGSRSGRHGRGHRRPNLGRREGSRCGGRALPGGRGPLRRLRRAGRRGRRGAAGPRRERGGRAQWKPRARGRGSREARRFAGRRPRVVTGVFVRSYAS